MRLCSTFTLAALLGLAAALSVRSAHAQTYNVLYSLPSGTGNGYPVGVNNLGPVNGSPGYVGVTPAGGFVGSGTLFTLSAGGNFSVKGQFDGYSGYDPSFSPQTIILFDGTQTYYLGTAQGGSNNGGTIWIYSVATGDLSAPINFCAQPNCTDGETPSSGIAFGGTTVWGTTYHGGAHGNGTVYRYEDWTNPPGNYAVAYSFAGGSDGANPAGDFLAVQASGLRILGLYGVTEAGGAYGLGTIFKVVPCVNPPCGETTLHSFGGPGDGQSANGVIVQVGSGSAHSFLYGTTWGGGAYGRGTVFQFDLTAGQYKLLYSFTGGSDGGNPEHNVAYGAGGVLYGTALSGGSAGYGTLWQLSGTLLTVLHAFCSSSGCTDGKWPGPVQLSWSAPGDIVGAAQAGGENGAGVIFEYAP
jgi:uncharacterized repeat protein (TIGR03803 family)